MSRHSALTILEAALWGVPIYVLLNNHEVRFGLAFIAVNAFRHGVGYSNYRRLFRELEHRSANDAPPLNAAFLFYLFRDAQNCDALVGDLEERYKIIRKKFGVRRANFWYWTQAIRSVGPIAWAWGKKIVMKPVIGVIAWAVARGLIGHDGWLAALVEIWKRIRG